MPGIAATSNIRDPREDWPALRRLADEHAGYFTTRQVLQTGCEARIRAALTGGEVIRVGIGLLRMTDWPHGPHDELAMWSAWFDGKAAVSHHSAAELYGLGRLRPAYLHLCADGGRRPAVPGLVVLRRRLRRADVVSAGTFLVTTPLRTVLDLAETGVGQPVLDEVVADAVAIGRCAADELRVAATTLPPAAASRVRRALTRAQ